jgi:hypothetical protein
MDAGTGAGRAATECAGDGDTGAWKVTVAEMREAMGASSRVAGRKRHVFTADMAASAKGGAPS